MVSMLRQIRVIVLSLLGPTNHDPSNQTTLWFRAWTGDLDPFVFTVMMVPQILLMIVQPRRAGELWKRRPNMTALRYVDLSALARMHLLMKLSDIRFITLSGYRPVVGGINARYRHGLRLFQKFEAKTRLAYWDDKWFFCETVFEWKGMHMCTVLTKFLVRNWAGPLPTKEVLEKIGLTIESPPLRPELRHMFEALAEQ